MKLTICFDDSSLSLPKMRRPDNRQRIIEAVLDLAAAAGVDDVHIIAALGLHRRMHEDELRHVLGDRIYDAFHPRGMLYQHDAEDPDNLAVIGTTDDGEVLEINKRAADSDLVVYANVNQVAMDGGWKSIATGLASYRCLSHHHNPSTPCRTPAASWTATTRRCTRATGAWARCCATRARRSSRSRPRSTTTRSPTRSGSCNKREWEWTAKDRATFLATQKSLNRTPARLARKIFHSIEAPYA
jgi:lactate racemase